LLNGHQWQRKLRCYPHRTVRVLLRLIALICAFSVVATAIFMTRFGTGGISALLATGLFGVITLLGWLITFVAGSIAAVQLFRLKSSGRIAAAVLFGTMFTYYFVGLFAFREPGTAAGPIVSMSALLLLLLVIVLLPAAERAVSRT
jgi:hypothetical protein